MNPTSQETQKGLSVKSSDLITSLSQERVTESNAIEMAKGGRAFKGISQKFEVNSTNGTAGYSIPLPLSPSPGGFNPSLTLSYSSGSDNSSYGLSWLVEYPIVQCKTYKRLKKYRKDDRFMFSNFNPDYRPAAEGPHIPSLLAIPQSHD